MLYRYHNTLMLTDGVVRHSRPVGDILFQTSSIPDLDRAIIRARHKKVVVGGHADLVYSSLVFSQMRHQNALRSPLTPDRLRIVPVDTTLLRKREYSWTKLMRWRLEDLEG